MTFSNSTPASSGLETVLHTAQLARTGQGTQLWQYYYDAFNRRRAKVSPTGTVEEFFYDTGHQMLESTAPDNLTSPTYQEVDDYVWLGGQAIAVVRGSMTAGVRNADYTGNAANCSRYGAPGHCGPHLIINDWVPKPVMMVEKATGNPTGAALYDEFGHVNRAVMFSGASGLTGVLGRVSLPSISAGTTVEARPFWRRVEMTSGYVAFQGVPVTAASSEWGSWAPASGGTALASVTGNARTVQIDWVEYRRYNGAASGAVFTNLRFPGQYWDEETDLFENWNRYYDPSTGRYLSPEPVLHSPLFASAAAGIGRPLPAYAYAFNNPILEFDLDGLFPLPGNPSGLPAGWTEIPHGPEGKGGPGGERRFEHGSGEIIEWHPGQPGNEGGRDHWHWRDPEGKKHTGFEGDEYTDPPEQCGAPGPTPEPDDAKQREKTAKDIKQAREQLEKLIQILTGFRSGSVPAPGQAPIPILML